MSSHGKDPRSPAGSVAGGSAQRLKDDSDKNSNHLKLNLPEIYDGSSGKMRTYFI
jgi:hypothetical protein